MEIINATVQQYVEKYTSANDALLQEIEAFTKANHAEAHMLSGHLQGKFLAMLTAMIQPRRILEIGTFTGYSALSLANGLADGGMVHTIELRKETAAIAQSFFDRSDYKQQIMLHIGEALSIIDELKEIWDLVFIDADKPNYINYFNRVLPKVRKNGFILADNVLFHGQVLEKEVKGKNAIAIQAFNDYVYTQTDVEKLMLPLRDGLYLMRKLH